MYGIPYLDPAAGLVVGAMMMKVGWGYWIESKREVTDAALVCDVSKGLIQKVCRHVGPSSS